MLKKSFPYALLLLAVIIIFFFTCNKCGSDSNSSLEKIATEKISFTINKVEPSETRGMYNLADYMQNPQKFFFYAVAEEKLIIEPKIDPPGNYEYQLFKNEELWELDLKKSDDGKPYFEYAFKGDEVGGPYELELKVLNSSSSKNSSIKHIYVQGFAIEIPQNALYSSAKKEAITPDPIDTSRVAEHDGQPEQPDPGSPDVTTDSGGGNVVTPPPAEEKVSSVNFRAASTSKVGTNVRVTDSSFPASAVKKRSWVFGDGSPQKSSSFNTMNHTYFSAGTYTIRLCVNDNFVDCRSKQITIEPKEVSKPDKKQDITPPPPPPPPPVEKELKVKATEVDFSLITEAFVGDNIDLVDKTNTKAKINSRSWFVNGTKLNTLYNNPKHTFTKAGVYTVKFCVNDDKCKEKKITIKSIPSNPDIFSGNYLAKTGIRVSQICPDDEVIWHTGKSTITITPKQQIELISLKIYGDNVGKIDLLLTDSGNATIEPLKAKTVLKGNATTITLSDFGLILEPAEVYTLLILPDPDAGDVKFKDSAPCNATSVVNSDHVKIKYNGQMIVYDLTYNYD